MSYMSFASFLVLALSARLGSAACPTAHLNVTNGTTLTDYSACLIANSEDAQKPFWDAVFAVMEPNPKNVNTTTMLTAALNAFGSCPIMKAALGMNNMGCDTAVAAAFTQIKAGNTTLNITMPAGMQQAMQAWHLKSLCAHTCAAPATTTGAAGVTTGAAGSTHASNTGAAGSTHASNTGAAGSTTGAAGVTSHAASHTNNTGGAGTTASASSATTAALGLGALLNFFLLISVM